MRILLAEDTPDMNRVVTAYLTHEGFEVDSVFDGGEALSMLRSSLYSAAVLDIMMPVMDGLTVLRRLRESGDNTPVLLLTAMAEVDDRVAGLNAGANDYLCKPFSLKELGARVRAMIRVSESNRVAALTFGDIRLLPDTLTLEAKNSVHLSLREYELLEQLIAGQDRSLDAAYLLQRIWRDEREAGSDDVALYIRYLNAKLESVDSTVRVESRADGFRLTLG